MKAKNKSGLSGNVLRNLKLFKFWEKREKYLYNSDLRFNYRLYARLRQIKHEENVGIYEGSNIGVNIDWVQFGKIMEEKSRKISGDKSILTAPPINKKVKANKITLKNVIHNAVDMMFTSLDAIKVQ